MVNHAVKISNEAFQKLNQMQNDELKITGKKPAFIDMIDKLLGIEKKEIV